MDEWGIEETPEVVFDEYKAPKGRSTWDVMNSAINKKIKPTLEEKKKINEFMFHKLLSRFEQTLELALMFTTKNIPIENQYDIIDSLVPKGFVPFEKGKKKVSNSTITNISNHYRCSETLAERYVQMMPEHEIERINIKYNKKGKI